MNAMGATSIEWCDHSINPLRARGKSGAVGHYCEMVSPGCANCYASALQRRFGLPPFLAGQKRDLVELFLDEEKLQEVIRRRKPTRYFWCDMTDLFGEWVPDEWINRCFAAMVLATHHTHQVLTKRAARMRHYISGDRQMVITRLIGQLICDAYERKTGKPMAMTAERAALVTDWPLSNVWLGVSVENREQANARIPLLLETPAAVRFLSVEPLLEHIGQWGHCDDCGAHRDIAGRCRCVGKGRVGWVIVGGESGPNARPCDVAWIRSIVRQCQEAGVACFVKQDSCFRPGLQGRIPDDIWAIKEFPHVTER